MLGLLGQVSCGIDAGKSLEIVDKMGLIKVTAAGGHVRPVTIISAMNHLQDLLKAAYPAEKLRRKADFVGKKLNEAARTDADPV